MKREMRNNLSVNSPHRRSLRTEASDAEMAPDQYPAIDVTDDEALASSMAGLSTDEPWTDHEVAAIKETAALLKGMTPMPDPKLLAIAVLCSKLKPNEAVKKLKDMAKTTGADFNVQLSTTGLRLDKMSSEGFQDSEEWRVVEAQLTNSYATCGGDDEGRGIFWIRGGHIPKEAIQSGAAMRAGLLFWMACHADLSTLRNGVNMVIDQSKGASGDMKRSGLEGKMHKGFQSFPLRPQCIRIIVSSAVQRALVNSALSVAAFFTRKKVLSRILFVNSHADVAAALPLASMPSYAGGQVEEPVPDWVLRRLAAFPTLPDMPEYSS
jgi:hypothetical protein